MRKYKVGTKEIRLRELDDEEYSLAERHAKRMKRSLDRCPTCGGHEQEVAPGAGAMEFVSKTYRYLGEEHSCNCRVQMALFRQYLIANIPEQFMRLDWKDYTGPQEVRDAVQGYLDSYEHARRLGTGLHFHGEKLGTGKTFAVTAVGKELIQRGQDVFFCSFPSMISSLKVDTDELNDRLRDTSYLILDEILGFASSAQAELYSRILEEVVRHRTHFNLPILSTTNLSNEDFAAAYPRVYSLLAAKQTVVHIDGEDHRLGSIGKLNREFQINKETAPIT